MEKLLKEIIKANGWYCGEDGWEVKKFHRQDFGYVATLENEFGYTEDITVEIDDVFLFLYSRPYG